MQRESYMFWSWTKDLITSLQLIKNSKTFWTFECSKIKPSLFKRQLTASLGVYICIYIYLYIRRYVQDPNRIWDVYLDQHLIQLMFCILYFHFLVFYKKRDNSSQDSLAVCQKWKRGHLLIWYTDWIMDC